MEHKVKITSRDIRRLRSRPHRIESRHAKLLTGDLIEHYQAEDIMGYAAGCFDAYVVEHLTGIPSALGWFKPVKGTAMGAKFWPSSAVVLALLIARRLGAEIDGLDDVLEVAAKRLRGQRILAAHETRLWWWRQEDRGPQAFQWSADWVKFRKENGEMPPGWHSFPEGNAINTTRLRDGRVAMRFGDPAGGMCEIIAKPGAAKLSALLLRHGCLDPAAFSAASLRRLMEAARPEEDPAPYPGGILARLRNKASSDHASEGPTAETL